MKNVLLFGATGNLGGLIAKELLARGAALRLLIRPGSLAKLAPEVSTKAEIVESETGVFDGIDTVVSAVQGGPETIVERQLAWYAAAARAGVKRFIPSDFSFDFLNLGEGENINSDWRRAFARQASAMGAGTELVHIMNGCFLDAGVLFGFLGAFDLNRREAYLWGDGNVAMDFTTYADTAAYTAAAALAEGPLPSRFQVAGATLTFPELVAEVEAGMGGGFQISVQNRGSMADLDAAIQQAQAEQPSNPYAWLPMMYWRGMLSGKGKLRDIRNSEYPEIRPESVRDYVARTMASR